MLADNVFVFIIIVGFFSTVNTCNFHTNFWIKLEIKSLFSMNVVQYLQFSFFIFIAGLFVCVCVWALISRKRAMKFVIFAFSHWWLTYFVIFFSCSQCQFTSIQNTHSIPFQFETQRLYNLQKKRQQMLFNSFFKLCYFLFCVIFIHLNCNMLRTINELMHKNDSINIELEVKRSTSQCSFWLNAFCSYSFDWRWIRMARS